MRTYKKTDNKWKKHLAAWVAVAAVVAMGIWLPLSGAARAEGAGGYHAVQVETEASGRVDKDLVPGERETEPFSPGGEAAQKLSALTTGTPVLENGEAGAWHKIAGILSAITTGSPMLD